MKTESEIVDALGGRMIVEAAQKSAPILTDFIFQTLGSKLDEDCDLKSYLFVNEILSGAGIDAQPNSCEGHVIGRFRLSISNKLPATAAALGSVFKDAHLYIDNPNLWLSNISEFYMENGIHKDYEVISISDMLTERLATPYLEDYKTCLFPMFELQAIAYGAVDKIKFESKVLQDQTRSDIENAFTRLNEYGSLGCLEGAADKFLYRKPKTEDKQALLARWREIMINPLSIQFENACSTRFQWGSSYDSSMAWMNSKLDKHKSSEAKDFPDKAIRVFSEPDLLAKAVIDTLNLPHDVWVDVIRGSNEKHAEKLRAFVLETKKLISGLTAVNANPTEARAALTNYAVPLLHEANRMKADKRYLTDALLKVIVPAINFKDLHSSLKPGARKLLVDYVAAHHPEHVQDLKLTERGAALDSALGL